ncbi:MAG: phytanoyl-CoA dioxygenase [Candidatus Latescibacteria bacterium]|nr:phytanoyl-CoA dioxygenase [Candidatus Latescibacterota bacterium]
MDNPYNELRVSNDALTDAPELRNRLDDEGYLFFRRLQDPDQLLDLRRQIMAVCQAGGWLVAGTDPVDGIADIAHQCTEGHLAYNEVYHQLYRLEAFHQAGHWAQVMDLLEKIVAGPVLAHPHKIARMWFPQYTAHTTPIHQDFVHFQGVFETYTCWTPVGDCPIELGGLAVLPGSHKINAVHQHHFSLGAGGLAIDTDDLSGEWATTNYQLGDCLFFPSLTVHQALPNLTPDRLRLSLDNRYQAQAQRIIAEQMLEPHLNGVTPLDWPQVYQGWESEELQYYWKELDLEVVERNRQWGQQSFREALDQAREGDSDAQYHLRRIVDRVPDSPEGQAAQQVLAQLD